MKYRNDTFYQGNILRSSKIIKTKVLLAYNSQEDKFYDFATTFPYYFSLSFELDKLTEEEQTKYQQEIAANTFSYHPQSDQEEVYVDENSLTIFCSPNQRRGKK